MTEVDAETGEIFAGPYRRSADITDLVTALAVVQVGLENVEKSAENEAFKRGQKASRYVTLGDAVDEARPKLAAQGIALMQFPTNGDEGAIGVTTLLAHKSGQWIDSTLYVKPAQFTAQGAGGVITYLRRYALMAIIGLAPEDDDGNAASGIQAPASTPRASKAYPAAAAPSADKEQARRSYTAISAAIKSSSDAAELRQVYDPVLNEWGAVWLQSIKSVRDVPGNGQIAVQTLGLMVIDRMKQFGEMINA
jgi:ERF superfamily